MLEPVDDAEGVRVPVGDAVGVPEPVGVPVVDGVAVDEVLREVPLEMEGVGVGVGEVDGVEVVVALGVSVALIVEELETLPCKCLPPAIQ